MKKFISSFFLSKQKKKIEKIRPILKKINSLEASMEKLSDEELKNKTFEFQKRLEQERLDDILPEAYAALREASKRVLNMRHFDVQILGGIALFYGNIAEMKTGEGKTLTATLPLYLHSLTNKGAHLVTVNDYLARRDSEEMGKLFTWMNRSVGLIVSDLDEEPRRKAYDADITYGTNNEFAFDYLKDNMKYNLNQYVQREFNYCIVDEVDSILIDEARTPLLISGPSEGNVEIYTVSNHIIKLLKEEDFTIDLKSHSASFTDSGVDKIQKSLKIDNLFDPKNLEILHALNQSLKARELYKKDVDYVVAEGKVTIVDEFTGRLKHGSRWSDGLHQAVEAKESVHVKAENQTLASITFQNYFRLYKCLNGMTGTAETESVEFKKIYNLDVYVIPTNVLMIRKDEPDTIFHKSEKKYEVIVEKIQEVHETGRPILIGTISVESSEHLANILRKKNIKFEILNAKNHEREAQIIAKAGEKNSITLATNMAGRGTDIKLTDETRALDGLYIIGTERHEARRIDNQLRGRSGRQGDPGGSKFYLSLEDHLIKIMTQGKLPNYIQKDDNKAESGKIYSRLIESLQKKIEAYNFDVRKHLLDYDNVMNEQRQLVYRLRREILSSKGNEELVFEMIEDVNHEFNQLTEEEKTNTYKNIFHLEEILNVQELKEHLSNKFKDFPREQVLNSYKEVLLSTFDFYWKNHLYNMDHLKEGIGLRSHGQKDPLVEYRKESFLLFEEMKKQIKFSVCQKVFSMKLFTEEEIAKLQKEHDKMIEMIKKKNKSKK